MRPRIYLKPRVSDGLNHILGWGATKKQLASIIGVSHNLMQRIMDGAPVSQQTAVKVARALNEKLSWKDIAEVRYE